MSEYKRKIVSEEIIRTERVHTVSKSGNVTRGSFEDRIKYKLSCGHLEDKSQARTYKGGFASCTECLCADDSW